MGDAAGASAHQPRIVLSRTRLGVVLGVGRAVAI
jgi:hypothetical protein